MRGAHDSRRTVYIESDVLRRIEAGLASVDTDPDPDRPRLESGHSLFDASVAEANA
jgi:hypothetical protein